MNDKPKISVYKTYIDSILNGDLVCNQGKLTIVGKYNGAYIWLKIEKSSCLSFTIGLFTPFIFTNLTNKASKQDVINYIKFNLEKDYAANKIKYKLKGKNYVR